MSENWEAELKFFMIRIIPTYQEVMFTKGRMGIGIAVKIPNGTPEIHTEVLEIEACLHSWSQISASVH